VTEFTKEVINVIQSIPYGKVTSYGAIADRAGNPRGARAVVYILRSRAKADNLPWYRVVGKTGQIRIQSPEGFLTQKSLLEKEGVVVSEKGSIDMKVFGW